LTASPDIIMQIILDYIYLIGKGELDYKRLFDHNMLNRKNTITGLQTLADGGLITIHPNLDNIIRGGTFRTLILTEAGKQRVINHNKKLKEKKAEQQK